MIFETELYHLIRTKNGIEPHIFKEKPIDGVVHSFNSLSNRTSGHGRIYAIVNNLIIEYKHHTKLISDKQIKSVYEQVQDYLSALFDNGNGVKYDAILTDGIKITYFQFDGDNVHHTKLRNISVDDIDTIIKAILNNSTKKFEPINIIQDFSIFSISNLDSKEIAQILYDTLITNPTDKTKMLYEEWKCLMHLSVDDNGKSNDIHKRRSALSAIFNSPISDTETEYKTLFALQTIYAIIIKLIPCKVVDNLQYNAETNEYHDLTYLTSSKTQEFFKKMEDGLATVHIIL